MTARDREELAEYNLHPDPDSILPTWRTVAICAVVLGLLIMAVA